MSRKEKTKAKHIEIDTPDLTKAAEFQKLLVNFSSEQFYGLAQILEVPIIDDEGKLRKDFSRLENEMCDEYLGLSSKDKKKVIKNMKKVVEANLENGVD